MALPVPAAPTPPAAAAAGSPAAWRLFFALDPSPALRERLRSHAALWRWNAQARLAAPPRLHLTLVFMPAVEPRRLPELLRLGSRAAAAARGCTLWLDRAEVWPTGIAYLAPARVPQALLELQQGLLEGALAVPVQADRRAWSPHVTLARRAQPAQPPASFETLRWQLRGFSLQRSLPGGAGYEALARWRFGSPR